MPTMEGLAAYFNVSRPTIRKALTSSKELAAALIRGKGGRTNDFLRRQQQLADGYWFCAAAIDEKGKFLCRFPLEARKDECPEHPGEPGPGTGIKRAFCSPHVIASIWVGKNQHGQEDKSSILGKETKKYEEAELADLAREALEFLGEEQPDDDDPEERPTKQERARGRKAADADDEDPPADDDEDGGDPEVDADADE